MNEVLNLMAEHHILVSSRTIDSISTIQISQTGELQDVRGVLLRFHSVHICHGNWTTLVGMIVAQPIEPRTLVSWKSHEVNE